MLTDYLSRLELDATTAIPDDLLDGTIMKVTPVSTPDDPDVWLQEIEHYLLTGMVSPRVKGDAREKLVLHCRQDSLVDVLIYYIAGNGILRRVENHQEIPAILASFHSGVAGGHYMGEIGTENCNPLCGHIALALKIVSAPHHFG